MFALFAGTVVGMAVLAWPFMSSNGGMDFHNRQVAIAYRYR